MAHPNEDRIRAGYEAFAAADFDHIREEFFDPDIVWHVPGRNPLAGDYTGQDEVFGFFAKLIEVTSGSFQLTVHDVVANDEHGVALVESRAQRDGRTLEDRSVHVFHMRDGKVVEYWGLAVDPYAADEFFA